MTISWGAAFLRLIFLKPEVREFQRPAVVRHVADEFVAGSFREPGLDFQGDLGGVAWIGSVVAKPRRRREGR